MILLLLLTACKTEVESLNPPTTPGCVFIDAGHQSEISVQGHVLPPADVLGQVCWDESGQLATFDGDSLNLPIDEPWSYILFFRGDVYTYTPASLKGNIEVDGDSFEVANCVVELTLDVGRSRWLDCTVQFNLAEGSAILGIAEALLDATASELSAP